MMLETMFAAMMLSTVAAKGTNGREDEGMLPLLKRHEIQVPLSVGMPPSVIADQAATTLTPGDRVADKRIVRLVQKWLAAGILEDGKWSASEAMSR